jgi:uncharacterized protein
MKKKKKVLLLCSIMLVLVIITPLPVSIVLYEKFFGHRIDSNTREMAPTMEEYQSLERSQVQFPSNKGQLLTGYVYKKKNSGETKGLIVLTHGMGGGHIDYLEEINYLCNNGYEVLGFDNTGCNESEGKSMIGLVQSSIDLDYALRFVESNEALNKLPTLLYGHSWGGFAVCSVLNYDHNITAVVSRSGFNRSQDMLIETGTSMYGDFVKIASPYLYLYEKFKFGNATDKTAEKGVKNTDAKVFLLYGDKDKVISYDSSIYRIFKDTKKDNVITKLYTGKDHDVTISQEAMDYIVIKNEEGRKLDDKYNDKIPKEELEAYYKGIDKALARKLDSAVMQDIVDFYDAAVGTK